MRSLFRLGIPRRHASIFDDAHLGADGEGLDCHESQMPRHLPACICTGSGRVERQRRVERSRRVLQPSNRERKRVQRGRQCTGKTGGNRWSECVISAVSRTASGSRLICSRHRSILERPRAHGGCMRGPHYHTLHSCVPPGWSAGGDAFRCLCRPAEIRPVQPDREAPHVVNSPSAASSFLRLILMIRRSRCASM